MDRGEQTFASATRSRTVGLQVNADFEELAMLRALVETITLHADFPAATGRGPSCCGS